MEVIHDHPARAQGGKLPQQPLDQPQRDPLSPMLRKHPQAVELKPGLRSIDGFDEAAKRGAQQFPFFEGSVQQAHVAVFTRGMHPIRPKCTFTLSVDRTVR